jgi:hypothetical protein
LSGREVVSEVSGVPQGPKGLSPQQEGFWTDWQHACAAATTASSSNSSSRSWSPAAQPAASHADVAQPLAMLQQGDGTSIQQLQQQQAASGQNKSDVCASSSNAVSSASNTVSSSSRSGGSGGSSSSGRGSSAQSWSQWISAKGWRGESEVHKQQLLEWFGASPHKPLKGSAGEGDTGGCCSFRPFCCWVCCRVFCK